MKGKGTFIIDEIIFESPPPAPAVPAAPVVPATPRPKVTMASLKASVEENQTLQEAFPMLYGPGATDPDGDIGDVESDDEVARFFAKYTGFGGLFSTWHERHAAIWGFTIGMLWVDKTCFIPCPEFYKADAHYFYTFLLLGRADTKLQINAATIQELQTVVCSFWTKNQKAIVAAATAAGVVISPVIVDLINAILQVRI
jgi:hypothetical protein